MLRAHGVGGRGLLCLVAQRELVRLRARRALSEPGSRAGRLVALAAHQHPDAHDAVRGQRQQHVAGLLRPGARRRQPRVGHREGAAACVCGAPALVDLRADPARAVRGLRPLLCVGINFGSRETAALLRSVPHGGAERGWRERRRRRSGAPRQPQSAEPLHGDWTGRGAREHASIAMAGSGRQSELTDGRRVQKLPREDVAPLGSVRGHGHRLGVPADHAHNRRRHRALGRVYAPPRRVSHGAPWQAQRLRCGEPPLACLMADAVRRVRAQCGAGGPLCSHGTVVSACSCPFAEQLILFTTPSTSAGLARQTAAAARLAHGLRTGEVGRPQRLDEHRLARCLRLRCARRPSHVTRSKQQRRRRRRRRRRQQRQPSFQAHAPPAGPAATLPLRMVRGRVGEPPLGASARGSAPSPR